MSKAMKATRYKKELAHRHVGKFWIVEPKIDGMRMHAFIDTKDRVIIKSYANKVMGYWKGVFDEAIVQFVRKGLRKKGAYVLDGEVKLFGGTFQDTMSAKAEDAPKGRLRFMVFDHMPHIEWKKQECQLIQAYRTSMLLLAKTRLKCKLGNIIVVHHTMCNADDIKNVYQKERKAGHEGIVAKLVDGEYEWKRSKNWLKLKPLKTFDGTVTAIHEGEGKFKGMAGSLTVEGTIDDEHETPFVTNVNLSTNKVRIDFWKNRKKRLGQVVEIKAQEPSFKKSRGKVAALRHSKYITLREDK